MLRLAHGSTPTSTTPPPPATPPPVQAVASSSSTDTPRQQRTASDMLRGALLSDLQQQRREQEPPARERDVAGDPPAASPGQQRGAAQPSPDYAAYDPTGPELSSPVTSPEAAMALSAYEAAATQRGLVTVCFCMQHPAEPGQRMHVTGTAKELGAWACPAAACWAAVPVRRADAHVAMVVPGNSGAESGLACCLRLCSTCAHASQHAGVCLCCCPPPLLCLQAAGACSSRWSWSGQRGTTGGQKCRCPEVGRPGLGGSAAGCMPHTLGPACL